MLMHLLYVSKAPPGPGNSGAFELSVFKAVLKARHCRVRFVVKSLLKALVPLRLAIMYKNNSFELF